MAGEDEDITIDLRLHDYLAASAKAAADAIDDLGDKSLKTARRLLLLDKRAKGATKSLYELAAAARAADGSMGNLNNSVGNLSSKMQSNVQSQKQMQQQLGSTKKKTDDNSKATLKFGKVWEKATRIFKLAGPALAMLAKGMALVGAAGLLGPIAQNLLAVSAALIQLTSFAALAPTALGGLVAIAATGMLAFKGLGTALSAASTGDAKKLSEAMKGMPESAQKFVKQLQPTLKLFGRLQHVVQGKFFQTLDKSIPNALKNMLPVIQVGTLMIAREFGQLANNIGSFFSSDQGRRLFGRFFIGGQQLLSAFTDNIKPLLNGLSNVAVAVAPAWDRFTNGLSKGLGKASDWMSRISKDGSLDRWLDNAFEIAKNLWGILSDVAEVIGNVMKAAGGASGGASALGALGMALGEIAKWSGSLEGQSILQSFFKSLGDIAKAVFPILETIAGIIGTVLAPALADLVTALAPSINDFFDVLGDVLAEIAPYLQPIAESFGDLVVALTPLLPIIGDFVEFGLTQMADLLPVIVQLVGLLVGVFESFLGPLLENLTPILEALMPIVTDFFTAFYDAMQPIIPQLAIVGDMFAQFLQDHMQELMDMLPVILPQLAELGGAFGTLLVNALIILIPYLPQIFDLMSQIAGISMQLWPILFQIAIMFLQILIAVEPLIGFFIALIGAAVSMASIVIGAVTGVWNAFVSAGAFIAGAVNTIIGLIGNLVSSAGGMAGPFIAAASAISGAISGISGSISGVIGSIGNLISKASALASIDINPFKFAGGDVAGGKKYTVGEIGPEMWVGSNGRSELIGKNGMDPDWQAPGDGFIIPSFMLGAFKSLERGMANIAAGPTTDGVTTREVAAIAAAVAANSGDSYHYDITIPIHGDASNVDESAIRRAVSRAIAEIEKDRKERK